MNRPPRRLAATLTITLAALAVGLLAGCAAAQDKAAAPSGDHKSDVAAARQHAAAAEANPVVVNCGNKLQARPSSFILTCADANDALAGLRWVSWRSEAFGTGSETINTCTPNCAEGKFISYPALVTLWRPEPLPGHPGVRYFTRITRIYTGKRPPLYNCRGSSLCHPVTSTTGLWSRL
jgi:hypothetical protein